MIAPLTESTGGFTVLSKLTGQELALAMQRLWLTGKVTPFGARLLVEHTFESAERQPVEVVYAFMLPQDAALRSFRIVGEGFEVTSDLQPVATAVETYEEGIDAGSLAVLARQYVDGMVNLTVGNLRPGEPVRVILEIVAGVERHDDGFRFRFPFTLAPSYHAEAKSVSMLGEGEMELPPDEYGDLILPRWSKDASRLHMVGFGVELVGGQGLTSVTSPSHGITVSGEGSSRRVGMAVEADVPDRDLVLEAKAAEPWGVAWAGGGAISALVGSRRFGEPDEESPRRVVFVIDRSGSMHGRPFAQAMKAVEAGIAALRPEDRFSIVAFDNDTEALSSRLLEADDRNRRRAREFISQLETCGGTELAKGVAKAAGILGRQGGDLLLLTDGQVFGTAGMLETARQARARIHALGIGSASQDRFLAQLGRETGGQCRFLTARERVDLALIELFAGVSPAVASDVEVGSGGATLTTADVHAGGPLLVREAGQGTELSVAWAGGGFTLPLVEAPQELAETLRLLHGAARITELESRIAGDPEAEDAKLLESLSREYGLASRVMALVAVVKQASDRPDGLPVTKVVPVGMPQDVEMGAYFGQSIAFLAGVPSSMPDRVLAKGRVAPLRYRAGIVESSPPLVADEDVPFLRKALDGGKLSAKERAFPAVTLEDGLLEDASRLEADGGLPGATPEERITASLDLLERLIDHGSTRRRGPFRHHVRRLLDFLEAAELDEAQQERLAELIGRVD